MKATRFWISIVAGMLGGALVLSGCSAKKSASSQDADGSIITVELNGHQIEGSYEGETENGLPWGKGEVTVSDGENSISSIVGDFSDGILDGDVEVKYTDGSVESGKIKDGYYNGKIKKEEKDGSYQYVRFTKGVKSGKTVSYDAEGRYIQQNWYYNGILLTDLIDSASEYDIEEYYINPYSHFDEVVKIDGYVERVFQSAKECIIKIKDEQGRKIYATYPNGKYNREKPTIIPVIETGDYVTVYGNFSGTSKNEYSADEEDYGFSFPQISVFYAEVSGSVFDAFERPTEPYRYEEIVNSPYSYSEITMDLEGTVENTVINYGEEDVYCKLVTDEGNVYYVWVSLSKLDDLGIPLTGDRLKVRGTIMGNYKQVGMSEGKQTFEVYPLVTISKIYE